MILRLNYYNIQSNLIYLIYKYLLTVLIFTLIEIFLHSLSLLFFLNTKQTYNNKNGCFIYLFYCFFYSNMAQIFTNNNSCKLKSQSFYKSEPNLVFNLDNKNKILSNNIQNQAMNNIKNIKNNNVNVNVNGLINGIHPNGN